MKNQKLIPDGCYGFLFALMVVMSMLSVTGCKPSPEELAKRAAAQQHFESAQKLKSQAQTIPEIQKAKEEIDKALTLKPSISQHWLDFWLRQGLDILSGRRSCLRTARSVLVESRSPLRAHRG